MAAARTRNGYLLPSKVWKQRISDGAVIESRENPRAAFEGHTLETPWDDLHFLYFCGYATYQYINWPYLLARTDISTKELEQHKESNQTWRVLEVTYPDQAVFATHSKVQKYYVDENFILRRHEYAPGVLGGSLAAHYVFDPISVGGMTFPLLRHVVAVGPVGENGSPEPMLQYDPDIDSCGVSESYFAGQRRLKRDMGPERSPNGLEVDATAEYQY